jgi:dTDP-4-amino-4,6-dideoxygalactose transaminase
VRTYPFIRPTIPPPEAWLEHLAPAYRERRYSNFGPVAGRLERELRRKYAPEREVVLTASGTAGLLAALLAVEAKGRVAVPSFTFPATAAAVVLAGCKPLFLDVSPATWELDTAQLEAILEREEVGAVVHVRTLGLCHSLDRLERLAGAAGVPLIIDAAASLGGREPGGGWAGARGDAEVFSLHATKVFGVGEGGAVFVRPSLAGRLRRTINFGLAGGVPETLGLNGKLSELHAAVGLAVLERIDGYLERRRAVARRYRTGLAGVAGLRHPPDGGEPPWQTYPVALPGDAREAVERLAAADVEARRYYTPPLHRTPPFAPFAAAGQLPVSDDLAARMICLPVYSDMNGAELEEILDIANGVLADTCVEAA